MHNDPQKILLGKAPQPEAERIKATMFKHGIEIALAHNAMTCASGGCGIQLEVWAHPDDVKQIQQIIALDWQANAAHLGHDPSLAEHVFDPSAAKVTCPACAAEFVPSKNECPDCGLNF
jgi:hypothetical protein